VQVLSRPSRRGIVERVSPAQRRAQRQAEYKKADRNRKRRQAYYRKFVADRPARCNECGATKTAKEMAEYARREVSVKNRCHECLDREFGEDYEYEDEYPGERIWWKTG
jgi:hypothetical protein